MVSKKLQRKIDRAIKLIRSASHEDGRAIEVAYSGGKDSDVILQLTKESGINYQAIYRNTTIDPPGTIQHVRAMGATIIQPERNFVELMEKKGQPTRLRRFCCSILKEYKIFDRSIVGVRAGESPARKKRYKEPTQCRIYSKTQRVEQFFPILDWTLADIEEYIKDRGLTLAPSYYDGAELHLERRNSCMCCPLQSKKNRISSFKQYPRMVKLYLRGIRKYQQSHPLSKLALNYTPESAFVRDVFCRDKGEWEEFQKRHPGITQQDYRDIIKREFGVNLD